MRQLDTCDFCGAGADGVYEVVPASVAGDPKRLALCADCRTTLQSVVDPLLDAAEASAPEPGTAAERDASGTAQGNGGDAPTTTADSGTAVDDAIDAEGDGDDAGAEVPPADAADTPTDASAGRGAPADGTDEATGGPAGADGVTIEAAAAETDGEAEVEADDEADDPETPPEESRERRPDGYAQIVRLLQNRDGAMPREDLRVLATNAYDIGGPQFEDAVDATVENGDVEETADGLRTV